MAENSFNIRCDTEDEWIVNKQWDKLNEQQPAAPKLSIDKSGESVIEILHDEADDEEPQYICSSPRPDMVSINIINSPMKSSPAFKIRKSVITTGQ